VFVFFFFLNEPPPPKIKPALTPLSLTALLRIWRGFDMERDPNLESQGYSEQMNAAKLSCHPDSKISRR
jgi:hypothetical protein